MKKILAVLIAVTMIFTFCSCTNNSNEKNDNNSSLMDVDKSLLDVTINLPADMFKDKSAEEIIANAKEEGYKSCTVNDDGSVTYVMSKTRYNEAVNEMKDSIAKGCTEKITDTSDYKYITDIRYNDDFSEFKIYIDTDVSETIDLFTTLELFLTASYYQSFIGYSADKLDTRLIVLNDATGEEINSISLKEWRESANEESATNAE